MPRKFCIKVNQIREEYEECLKNNIFFESIGKNDFEKRLISLKIEKTTICILSNKNPNLFFMEIESNFPSISNLNLLNNTILNSLNNNSFSNSNSNLSKSTYIDSKLYQDNSNLILTEIIENKFNSARVDYCLRHKIYDIPLTHEIMNFNHPLKYKINEKYYAFVYPNEQITYLLTISGFLLNGKEIKNPVDNKINDYKYNSILGLYFCGENIELKIDNEIIFKRCSPNDFICKKCMEINKNIYSLKNHYLINIIGRISRINKGRYHCFGHFMINNQIKECITKFCCKGCYQLNLYSKYFQ